MDCSITDIIIGSEWKLPGNGMLVFDVPYQWM